MKTKKCLLLLFKGLWALDTCKFLVKALFFRFQPSLVLSRCLNSSWCLKCQACLLRQFFITCFEVQLPLRSAKTTLPPFYRWQNWVVRRPRWWTVHAKYNYQLFIPTCINHFCMGGEVGADTCPLTNSEVILEIINSHVLLGFTFYYLIVDVWQGGDTAETKTKRCIIDLKEIFVSFWLNCM